MILGIIASSISIVDAGTEVFPQNNAASASDDNATTGWTGVNATKSVNTTDYTDGVRSIDIESTTTGTCRGEITWTQTDGAGILAVLWVKVTQGTLARVAGWTGFVASPDTGYINTTSHGSWTKLTYYLKANAVEGKMRIYSIYNTSGTIGDTILVDGVSIIEDTFDAFPQDNAASSVYEVNATTNWTSSFTTLTTGTGNDSTYSIKGTATSSFAYQKINDITVISGSTYTMYFDSKFTAVNGEDSNAELREFTGLTTTPTVDLTSDTTWTSHELTFTTNATTVTARFYSAWSGNSNVGDILEIDNVRLIEQ